MSYVSILEHVNSQLLVMSYLLSPYGKGWEWGG